MSAETQKKQASTPETLTMPVKDIVIPDKWNRHKATDMKGLISSIKKEGQLVPLLVRLRDDGKTELVDGRRRSMALKELKIKDAKIVYAEGDAKRDYLKSLVANLQRQQHNPVEKAEASGLPAVSRIVPLVATSSRSVPWPLPVLAVTV